MYIVIILTELESRLDWVVFQSGKQHSIRLGWVPVWEAALHQIGLDTSLGSSAPSAGHRLDWLGQLHSSLGSKTASFARPHESQVETVD